MNNLEYSPCSADTVSVVVAGGGAGPAAMAGLKDYLPVQLTAVVSMCDQGGSAGRLRHALGMAPVGDIRRNLSALAGDRQAAAAFEHRFDETDTPLSVRHYGQEFLDKLAVAQAEGFDPCYAEAMIDRAVQVGELTGDMRGHPFGNLVLAALTQDQKSVTGASETAGHWLQARGRVLPVTETRHTLMMQDGPLRLRGEDVIDEHTVRYPETAHVWLRSDDFWRRKPGITPEVRKVITEADALIMSPGSLYTSLLPLIHVRGLGQAVRQMRERGGLAVAIGNLEATHETGGPDGLCIAKTIRKLEEALQGPAFSHVLYNNDPSLLPEGVTPLPYDPLAFQGVPWQVYGLPLASSEKVSGTANDVVKRSTVRHEASQIAGALQTLLQGLGGSAVAA